MLLMMNHLRYLTFVLAFAWCAATAHATVAVPAYFSDNMVVQQSAVITIKGTSSRGGKVVVGASWSKKKYTGTADKQGCFAIELPTPKASLKAHTITISDGDALTLRNVLVGEVWLCAGQSNMEMPVGGWGKVDNFEAEIRDAQYPHIRLLQVKKGIAHKPMDWPEVNGGGWQVCSPLSVENFSATAYFFARQL